MLPENVHHWGQWCSWRGGHCHRNLSYDIFALFYIFISLIKGLVTPSQCALSTYFYFLLVLVRCHLWVKKILEFFNPSLYNCLNYIARWSILKQGNSHFRKFIFFSMKTPELIQSLSSLVLEYKISRLIHKKSFKLI